MEIACLITDNHLNVVAEHPSIVINQPDSLLETMDEWCQTTHAQVIPCDLFKKQLGIDFNSFLHSFIRRVSWMNAKSPPLRKSVRKKQYWNFSIKMVSISFHAHWLAIVCTWTECFCANLCRASINISTIALLMCQQSKSYRNDGIRRFSRMHRRRKISIVDWMISRKASKSLNITKITCSPRKD